MADLQEGFQKYIENISLTTTKKESLVQSRDANRDRITSSFKEKDRKIPGFRMQGSFIIHTTINPLKDCEYDLDDGVYLNNYDSLDDCPAPATTHRWIIESVEGYTNADPIDKNTCVRVPYSGGYHIDLPIYTVIDNKNYLAHKAKGWVESDPKEISDWFKEEYNRKPDLLNVVKCLKGWRDYKEIDLKSIVISILAANCYQASITLQKTLKNTLSNIYQNLSNSFSCMNPNDSTEDLIKDNSQTKKEQTLKLIGSFYSAMNYSIDEESECAASTKLTKYFGDRFPVIPDKEKRRYEKHEPGVINGSGRSAN